MISVVNIGTFIPSLNITFYSNVFMHCLKLFKENINGSDKSSFSFLLIYFRMIRHFTPNQEFRHCLQNEQSRVN